jgi:hypothetical protein
VATIPAEKRAAETAEVFWRDQDLQQTFDLRRSTSNTEFRRSLNVEHWELNVERLLRKK